MPSRGASESLFDLGKVARLVCAAGIGQLRFLHVATIPSLLTPVQRLPNLPKLSGESGSTLIDWGATQNLQTAHLVRGL